MDEGFPESFGWFRKALVGFSMCDKEAVLPSHWWAFLGVKCAHHLPIIDFQLVELSVAIAVSLFSGGNFRRCCDAAFAWVTEWRLR